MDTNTFESLRLNYGELILIEKQGSHQFTGYYYGEYNNSKLTFKFSNNSNGKIELIDINKLQQLRRI